VTQNIASAFRQATGGAMARHKKIAFYKGDWDLFDTLKEEGYVLKEYDYTNPKAEAGVIYLAKWAGEEFISIATNVTHQVHYSGGRRRRSATYRIMYRLTEEGWQYLKGLLVEESF
jgi:hypothetical protein